MTKSERFRALSWIANLGLQAQARHDMDEHLARGCIYESKCSRVVADQLRSDPADYLGSPVWRIERDRRTVVAYTHDEAFAIAVAAGTSRGNVAFDMLEKGLRAFQQQPKDGSTT